MEMVTNMFPPPNYSLDPWSNKCSCIYEGKRPQYWKSWPSYRFVRNAGRISGTIWWSLVCFTIPWGSWKVTSRSLFPSYRKSPPSGLSCRHLGWWDCGGLARWLVKSQLASQSGLDPGRVSCPLTLCQGLYEAPRGGGLIFSADRSLEKALVSHRLPSFSFPSFTFPSGGHLPYSVLSFHTSYWILLIAQLMSLYFLIKLNFHFWWKFLAFVLFFFSVQPFKCGDLLS